MAFHFGSVMDSRMSRGFSPYTDGILNSIPANTLVTSPNDLPTSQTTLMAASTVSTSIETLASIQGDRTVYITIHHGPTSTAVSDPLTDSALDKDEKAPLGAIVGGVLGGVAVLTAILVLFLYLRNKKLVKERRRATLPPPPYASGDMSEQLCGGATTTTSSSSSGGDTVPETSEKIRLRDAEQVEREHEPVPQLDGTMIQPANEIGGDAVGSIAELPAVERNPSDTTNTAAASNTSGRPRRKRVTGAHVMSWAQFNAMGTRDETSRLSQPHSAPDPSAAVWENMSPTKDHRSEA